MKPALKVATAVLAVATPAWSTVDAEASSRPRVQEVCVSRVALLDTPDGLAVAYLAYGTDVRELAASPTRRWLRVRGPHRLTGWARARSFC